MDFELFIAAIVFIVPMCFTPGPNNVLCLSLIHISEPTRPY